jgi:hypothetical protein
MGVDFGIDYAEPEITVEFAQKGDTEFVQSLKARHYRVVVTGPVHAWAVDPDTHVRLQTNPYLLTEGQRFEFYNTPTGAAWEVQALEKEIFLSVAAIQSAGGVRKYEFGQDEA